MPNSSYTIAQLATLAGVNERSVRRAIQSGALKATGSQRKRVVDGKAAEQWLAARHVQLPNAKHCPSCTCGTPKLPASPDGIIRGIPAGWTLGPGGKLIPSTH